MHESKEGEEGPLPQKQERWTHWCMMIAPWDPNHCHFLSLYLKFCHFCFLPRNKHEQNVALCGSTNTLTLIFNWQHVFYCWISIVALFHAMFTGCFLGGLNHLVSLWPSFNWWTSDLSVPNLPTGMSSLVSGGGLSFFFFEVAGRNLGKKDAHADCIESHAVSLIEAGLGFYIWHQLSNCPEENADGYGTPVILTALPKKTPNFGNYNGFLFSSFVSRDFTWAMCCKNNRTNIHKQFC